MYFLTHVEPLHLHKGKEVLFFIREISSEGKSESRSHVTVKEIPHHFYTRLLARDEAEGLFQELQPQPDLRHLTLEFKHYNLKRAFLRATGSKEDKLLLSPPFLCRHASAEAHDPLGLNSPTKLLNWFYPPGLLLASPDEIPLPEQIQRREYVTLEQIVNDSQAVLDIEVEDWEFGRDHIFMVVYSSSQHQVLFHDLPFTDPEQEGFQLISFTSPQDLGDKLTELLHQDDPLWLFGHNIMNYDQIKIRDLTGKYFPAVNKHYPIVKATQGFGRVITKGRWTLDSYGYTRHYQNIHARSSLGTLSDRKVPLGHPEQARLVKNARQGSRPAFQELAHYCLGDAQASAEVGRRYKTLVALKAQHFGTAPDVICSTSKRRIAHEYWNRRHFLTKGVFANTGKRWREESTFSLEELARYTLPRYSTPGFHDQVQVLYLTPFVAGAREILQKTAASLLAQFPASHDGKEKFDLLQTLNTQLTFLIEQSLTILDPALRWRGKRKEENEGYARAAALLQHLPPLDERQRARFYCLFTYRGLTVDPLTFLESLARSLQRTTKALQRYDLINAGKFYFLRSPINVQRLEEDGYGCWLGTGPVLSLSPRRVVANPFQALRPAQYLYDGFNPRRGEKTEFEKRLLERLVKEIFAGVPYREIKRDLDREVIEFSAGKKPREDYFISIAARTYYAQLLGRVLEERSFSGQVPEAAYTEFLTLREQRLKNKLSKETEKMLAELIQQCQPDFSYPFLHDCEQELLQPYPLHVNLIYASGYQAPVPAGLADQLDLERYRQKIQQQFADFYQVLEQKQLKLAL